MTAVDLYNKFIKNGRSVTSHVYDFKLSLQSVRTSLYRMRKQKGETFQLKTDDLTLTIHDGLEA
jgi:hypothetical protein